MKYNLGSQIHPLRLPLPSHELTGWKAYPVFSGPAAGLRKLECHVSLLNHNCCPHPPHAHQEEELLLLLSGEVELILPDEPAGREVQRKLKSGQLVYYPCGFAHTLRTTSQSPATYLMFKWSGRSRNRDPLLGFLLFSLSDFEERQEAKAAFFPQVVFEGPTAYLSKLHCHISTLSPGAGYEPHADPYDVAVVVLEGEVRTLGRRAEPYDVIFYAAGEAHGLRNPGEKTARYIVFEFHGRRTSRWGLWIDFFLVLLARLTDPRRLIDKGGYFIRPWKGRRKNK